MKKYVIYNNEQKYEVSQEPKNIEEVLGEYSEMLCDLIRNDIMPDTDEYVIVPLEFIDDIGRYMETQLWKKEVLPRMWEIEHRSQSECKLPDIEYWE